MRAKGVRLEAGGEGKEGEQGAKITCIRLRVRGLLRNGVKSVCCVSK